MERYDDVVVPGVPGTSNPSGCTAYETNGVCSVRVCMTIDVTNPGCLKKGGTDDIDHACEKNEQQSRSLSEICM